MTDNVELSETDALRRARDRHHVLSGEQEAGTDDAFQWLAVYTELIEFKKTLLEEVSIGTTSLSPTPKRAVGIDVAILARQADRYRERLRHWQRVVTMTGGVPASTGQVGGASGQASAQTDPAPALAPARRKSRRGKGMVLDVEDQALVYLAAHGETTTEREDAVGKLARRVAHAAKAAEAREPMRLECLQSLVSTPGVVGNLKKYARDELTRLGIPLRMASTDDNDA